MILLYFIYESIDFLAIQQYLFSGWMILVLLTVSFSLANAHEEAHYSQRFGFELLVPGVGNLLRKNFVLGLATIVVLIIIHFMYMFRILPLETALLLTFSISCLSFSSLFIQRQKKADR